MFDQTICQAKAPVSSPDRPVQAARCRATPRREPGAGAGGGGRPRGAGQKRLFFFLYVYPATAALTYMDVAARGLISRQVRAALDAHLDVLTNGDVNKEDFFALVERTRARFASMIHAQTDEITFTKNVSEGLNMVATPVSPPPRRGRGVAAGGGRWAGWRGTNAVWNAYTPTWPLK